MKFITLRTSGLSIIEISIAMLISSLLTLALYQAFNTSQKVSESISATMNAEQSFAIGYNQLEKDFSAIFVPERVFAELIEKNSKKPTDKTPDKNSEKSTDQKQEKEKPPFKDIFVCTLKDKDLESISFLSTHSLPLYNSKSPNAVRVVYRLTPQQNSDFFALTRQESTQLDVAPGQFKEKNIRAYDLMNSIKSLTVSFTVTELPKKDSSSSPLISSGSSEAKTVSRDEAAKPTPKKYIPLTIWPKQEAEKKQDYLIPAYIILKGIFVDDITAREYPFEWVFPVAAYDDVMLRLQNIEKKNPEKPDETQEATKEQNKKEQSQQTKNKNQGQQKTGNGQAK